MFVYTPEAHSRNSKIKNKYRAFVAATTLICRVCVVVVIVLNNGIAWDQSEQIKLWKKIHHSNFVVSLCYIVGLTVCVGLVCAYLSTNTWKLGNKCYCPACVGGRMVAVWNYVLTKPKRTEKQIVKAQSANISTAVLTHNLIHCRY